MKNHRFILEPYKGTNTRYRCPNCNKNNVFTIYLDVETNEHVNEKVGICNRKIKCGYHYTPKQFFQENGSIKFSETYINTLAVKPNKPTSYIEEKHLCSSLNHQNYFLDFLSSIWDNEIAQLLAEKYFIGTSTHWRGSTIFWQADIQQRIRTGKVMLYNGVSGRRVKKPYNHINWMHKILKLTDFNLKQCFFGEHLLNGHAQLPVAIVESEKTAVIASVYLPEFVWLACGSVNNLSKNKTQVLRGRDVILFPDLKCYNLWNEKTVNFEGAKSIQISDLLEVKATSGAREKGFDLADYLIQIK